MKSATKTLSEKNLNSNKKAATLTYNQGDS
jgi:hypothetical protein